MVSPWPDVRQVSLTPHDHLLLLASDGLWNALPEDKVRAAMMLSCPPLSVCLVMCKQHQLCSKCAPADSIRSMCRVYL